MEKKATQRRLQEAEEVPIDYDWEQLRLDRHSHEVQKLADKLGIDLTDPVQSEAPATVQSDGPGFWNRTGEFVSNLGKSFAELGEGAVRLLTETPLAVPTTPEAKEHLEYVDKTTRPFRDEVQRLAHIPVDIANEAVDYYSEGDPSWWSKLGSDILSESVFPGATLKKVEGVGPLLKEGAKLIPWNVGLQTAREFSQLPENPEQSDYENMAKRLGLTAAISPLIGAGMAKYLGKADDVAVKAGTKAATHSLPVEDGVVQMQAIRRTSPDDILSKPPIIKDPQPLQIQKSPVQAPRGNVQLPKGDVQGRGGELLRAADPPLDPTIVPRHYLPDEANAELALRTMKAQEELAAGATEKPATLTSFIHQHGGLQDQGGELSHMGVDEARKPFQRKLTQEDGLTLDQAAELAHEAGLLESRDINLLLDTLDSESRGLTSKTPQWFDDATKGPGKLTPERVKVALEKIEKDKGVDVGRDVEKVKEALLGDPSFQDSPYAPQSVDDWESAVQMVAPRVAPDRRILKSYPPELPKSPPPTEFSDDLFPTEFVDDVAKQEAPMPSAKNTADMSPDEALRHVIAKARAADEAMAKTKPQQLGERGAVVLGKQSASPQPSPHVFRDPQMEKTFQLGREAMDTPSFLDRVYEGLEDMAHGWTRTFKHLPNTPKFSRANEYLSQLKNAPRYGAERAIRVMRGIVDDLTPDEFDLFERLIIMQDANFDALAGKTLPDGWTPRGVANELQHLTQKSLQTPKVQQAIDLRFRMINQLREELTDAGILNIDPANVNPHYFPHIVRDYAEEAIKQAESGAGLSIKKQTPWYAKSRKGTNKLYNFNYLEAESAYLQKAYTDLQMAETIKLLKDDYDIVPKLQKAARDWNTANPGQPARTWKDMPRPKGYSHYVVDPSATFYSAFSTGEHVIEAQITGLSDALLNDKNLSLTLLQRASADDMLKILEQLRPTKVLGRPKAPMVIPDELKKTLIDVGRGHSNNAWRKLNGMIKEFLLIAPQKVLRYNINNLIGDMEAVWVGNSKILTDGKLDHAVRELFSIVRGKIGPTADYLDALRLGVIDTGQITAELTDPNAFSSLMKIDPRVHASWGKMAGDLIKQGWGSIRKWNQFRENMLRYAAYKHYKRVLDAGESFSYGASKKELVDALATNAEKAGKMARELLGDYAAVSQYGQMVSRDVMMFYRWMEVNATRYNQILQNTQQEAGSVSGKGAVVVASKLAKLMTWMGMVSLWNKYIIGEDWEKLPAHARAMPNVVLPMYLDENGMPRYIRTEGSFADLMKTLGFDDILHAVQLTMDGEMDMGQAIQEIAKAAPMSVLERVGTGAYPAWIGGAELITGKSFWPDAQHPRPIQDWGRHWADKFGLKNGYDLLSGNKEFNPDNAFLDMFSYKPSEKTDFYESRNNVSDWKQRRGGGAFTYDPPDDPEYDMMQDYIKALESGDKQQIQDMLPEAQALLKSDPKKYKRIMDNLDPAVSLGKTDKSKFTRQAWLDSLKPEERRRYDRAFERAKLIRKQDPLAQQVIPKREKAARRYRELWGF